MNISVRLRHARYSLHRQDVEAVANFGGSLEISTPISIDTTQLEISPAHAHRHARLAYELTGRQH